MYARVARFEKASPDQQQRMAESLRATEGPPEGVPAKGILFLADGENGRTLAITLYESEDDMHTGDAALRAMNPPDVDERELVSVEFYEVAAERRL